MITKEALIKDYQPVTTDTFVDTLAPTDNVQLADLHLHSWFDTLATPRRIIRSAARQGIDVVSLTEHDYWTPKSQRHAEGIAKKIRDREGVDVDIIAASEATVLPLRDEANRKGKHVLVFNQRKPLSSGLNWEQLRYEADEQEALLYIAHPNLAGLSFNRDEIEIMVNSGLRPDGIEIQNGSAALIDRHPYVAAAMHRFNETMPLPGSNREAQNIHAFYRSEIPGYSGGSDAHEAKRVGEIVTVFPENMDLFTAMKVGKIHIAEKRSFAPIGFGSVTNVVLGSFFEDPKPQHLAIKVDTDRERV